MKFRTPAHKGFTLIEVLVALAIIGILGLVAVVGYQQYISRARAADILVKYDAIRTGVGSQLASGVAGSCAEQATRFSDANLKDEYASLRYGFAPAAGGGFRPVLTVCAKADGGTLGVRVARGAHDALARTASVEAGAMVSDTVVAFSLPLTAGNRATCKAYEPPATDTVCGAPVAANPRPTTPPPSGQAPTSGPTSSTAPTPDASRCPPGQAMLGGQCVCAQAGKEMIGGQCVDACWQGHERRAGQCVSSCNLIRFGERRNEQCCARRTEPLPNSNGGVAYVGNICDPVPDCPDGQGRTTVGGACIPVCRIGQQMVNGQCVAGCAQGLELVGGQCVAKCAAPQVRNAIGVCAAPAPASTSACTDTFLGDCGRDLDGMCDMDFVQELCRKTCGRCKP